MFIVLLLLFYFICVFFVWVSAMFSFFISMFVYDYRFFNIRCFENDKFLQFLHKIIGIDWNFRVLSVPVYVRIRHFPSYSCSWSIFHFFCLILSKYKRNLLSRSITRYPHHPEFKHQFSAFLSFELFVFHFPFAFLHWKRNYNQIFL